MAQNPIPIIITETTGTTPFGITATNPLRIDPTGNSNQPVQISAATMQVALIAASTIGSNVILAPSNGWRICLVSLVLVAAGAVNMQLQDSATTNLTGILTFPANGQLILPFNPAGWVITTYSVGLNLNLSATVAVGGCMTFTLV